MLRILAVVFTILVSAGTALAQPGNEPKPPTVEEMASLIASYPKDLWEPMLTLSSHPKVLERLAKKESPDTVTAGMSAEVKQAAVALGKEPEAAEALAGDKEGAAVIGKAYHADKQKVLAEVGKEAEVNEKATDHWTKRLSGDGDAINQMTAALKGYQQQQGATLSADDAAAEAGVSVNGGAVNVNALPSPGFSKYVMNNADVYPALSDVMVSQWLGGRNPAAYDHTFNHWHDHFNNSFHDEHFFHNDEHRQDRLADAARYDRKYANDDHRWDHFNEHRRDYEHLGKVNPPPKDHQAERNHKPQVRGGGEHHVRHKAEAGQHPKVNRGHATHHQSTHHAARSHQHHAAHHRGGKR